MNNKTLLRLLIFILVLGIVIVANKFRSGGIAYLYLLGVLYVGYGFGVYVYLYKSNFALTCKFLNLTALVAASALAFFLASLVYMSSLYVWVTCIFMVLLNLLYGYFIKMRCRT